MKAREFFEAMGELDLRYVEEAARFQKRSRAPLWIRWGAAAACLCLMAVSGILLAQNLSRAPQPPLVEVPSPILPVSSVEEMERYLDFDVPVLEKEAAAYSVLVLDGYPAMGQIDYADGSQFRVQYDGDEDISGIYGGTLTESREVAGVLVKYYEYNGIQYAIWEQKGFSFSYVYSGDGTAEVETLIRQFQ